MNQASAPSRFAALLSTSALVLTSLLVLVSCGQPNGDPPAPEAVEAVEAVEEAAATDASPGASLEAATDEEGFTELFNGRDLEGWDANPELWKVEDGVIVGTCFGPEKPEFNEFLIWEGGTLEDFELRVVARLEGDNNSGVQYRSRRLPEFGPWSISGYQCDIHPAVQHNGMTYEERGRGIFGLNGQEVVLDPEGQRWLVSEHAPVEVDIAEWNEYGVVARGNRLVHTINGEISSTLVDFDEEGRALDGLLAIQLHRGNAHVLEIRSVRYKPLETSAPETFTENSLPEGATRIERPGTSNPQGLGPASGAKGKGKGKGQGKGKAVDEG